MWKARFVRNYFLQAGNWKFNSKRYIKDVECRDQDGGGSHTGLLEKAKIRSNLGRK
jgi:hypothetical protein